jgi:hypothetical protein
MKTPANRWTWDWPTEPGEYWFYGWRWGPGGLNGTKPAEMCLVKARLSATGSVFYVTNGHFLHKAEGAKGKWRKANVPSPPSLV